jgi:hypothetical protein
MRLWPFVALALPACSPSQGEVPPQPTRASTVIAIDEDAAARVRAANEKSPSSTDTTSDARAADPTFDEIASVLYAGRPDTDALAACSPAIPAEARVRCLFEQRYHGDAQAAHLANAMFVRWKIIAGTEAAQTMNGGYRGMIRLEPAVPTGADRKHLVWLSEAFADFDRFFAELARFSASPSADAAPAGNIRYRYEPITLRFMRSVGARTPSAYAMDWTVAWNLNGSLHRSADAVRETLFHEIFHLNDATIGRDESAWSLGALGSIFDGIVRKCGTKIPCLAPYSPNDTIVVGGTYYSFQPGNGVREYAAELALRYYREERATLRSLAPVKPFKCGPPENARAWNLLKDTFFGGIDAVPACK